MLIYSKFILGTGKADKITTTDEAHLILGLLGDDVIITGSGNDFIYGGADNDMITSGAGNDVIHGETGDDTIDAGAGDDTIHYRSGNDVIDGGDDHDTLIIRLFSPTEKAILSADMWRLNEITNMWEISDEGTHQRIDIDRNGNGSADNNDSVIYVTNVESLKWHYSGELQDLIEPSDDDILHGTNTDDVISGGMGRDILYGGGGHDVFVLGKDLDLVKDFSLEKDKIQVDLEDSAAITLEGLLSAANLRIDQIVVNDESSDFQDRTDTLLYATNNTQDSADDIILMVLEDFSQDLTFANFAII